MGLACRSDWLCLEPQSQIKYFLLCTRNATLACNASEFARQLPVTLAVCWRDNSFRLSHHWFSPAPKPVYKALTLLAVSRFRGRGDFAIGQSPAFVFWSVLGFDGWDIRLTRPRRCPHKKPQSVLYGKFTPLCCCRLGLTTAHCWRRARSPASAKNARCG